ncbi:MAG: NAD(P)/FAD-dependent oxidoreductase [Arcicella sp.]|jgi:cation diffusion facilitator CzcD-associated flavoprotein CzcO|nr:NAD(P)/FAD-dependent oxidoreductase [Arcicella sp.]
MVHTKNLIIGAGPAGLAMAGRFTKLSEPYILLEKSDKVASAWHQHYERLHLHTDKIHSALPHLPFSAEFPTYVSRLSLIDYYENYCQTFQINPVFNQSVISVIKENQRWHTRTHTGVTYISENVIICTGYNRVAVEPQWQGFEDFEGIKIHSKDYKNAEPFVGKKVLVVGMGNTGAEIALDLVENGANPSIVVRSPMNIIKRDFMGKPAQRLAIFLSQFPHWVYDSVGLLFRKLAIGDLSKYGIEAPQYAPSKQLRVFAKVPVIDIGTVAQIKKGNIKVLPDIQYFKEKSVVFKDNQTQNFEAIILATGYKAQLEDFIVGVEKILNDRHYPKALWTHEQGFEGMYFLGFQVPISGILRQIHLDSQTIVEQIMK